MDIDAIPLVAAAATTSIFADCVLVLNVLDSLVWNAMSTEDWSEKMTVFCSRPLTASATSRAELVAEEDDLRCGAFRTCTVVLALATSVATLAVVAYVPLLDSLMADTAAAYPVPAVIDAMSGSLDANCVRFVVVVAVMVVVVVVTLVVDVVWVVVADVVADVVDVLVNVVVAEDVIVCVGVVVGLTVTVGEVVGVLIGEVVAVLVAVVVKVDVPLVVPLVVADVVAVVVKVVFGLQSKLPSRSALTIVFNTLDIVLQSVLSMNK